MVESDVEMVGRGSTTPDVNLPPPSSAATSRRSSVAVAGEDGSSIPVRDASVSSSAHLPISIPVLVHSPPLPTSSGPSGSSVTAKPSSSSTKPASSAKPRSTKPAKPARSPSPSPPPPPPVVPLKTIRLQIRLGGPSNYEVDISRQAKDTGQRPPTPPAVVKKVTDSSDSDEDEDKDDKSRSKKNKVSYTIIFLAGYSVTFRYRRKMWFQNTTTQRIPSLTTLSLPLMNVNSSRRQSNKDSMFQAEKWRCSRISMFRMVYTLPILAYLSLTYRTPKKPKSKKISFVAGLQKSLHTEKKQQQLFEGTRETPITIDADEKRLKMEDPSISLPDEYAGQKRKRQNSTSEGGKRKKIIDEVCLLASTFFYLL